MISNKSLQQIDGLLDEYKDILGNDFAVRVRRGMEAFSPKEDDSGMRKTSDENLKVAVVGAFSCGKSTFINSILGDQVAPVEITPKTHGVTSFIFGEKETYDADGASITREQYQEQVQDGENTVRHFIVQYPCERLKSLEFMDSPGFGSVSGKDEEVAKKDTALSEEAVSRADVVFFLTNITEGVIQGDALARLEAICNPEDGAVNPHRRIYVILTWADKKAPGERANVQQSIQRLCQERKLPIEGVLLYSSLDLAKFKSEQMRTFFGEARENLFKILLDLQKFRVELMAYRQALKSRLGKVNLQQFLDSFKNDVRQILAGVREIHDHDVQRDMSQEWKVFREEAANCIYEVFKRKDDEDTHSNLIWYDHEIYIFKPNRMETRCQESLAVLTDEELEEITKGIQSVAKKHGYKLNIGSKGALADFFSKKSTKKNIPIEDRPAYEFLWDSYFREQEVSVFPVGSLRDSYLSICVEMVMSIGGPWSFNTSQEELFSTYHNKLNALSGVFAEEGPEQFMELIDTTMKNVLLKEKQDGIMKEFNTRLENLLGKCDALKDNSMDKEEEMEDSMDSSANGGKCEIIISEIGPKAMKVARTAAKLTGRDIEDLLEAFEEPPVSLVMDIPAADANAAKEELEALGATVEIKVTKAVQSEEQQMDAYRVVLSDIGSKAMKVARLVVSETGRDMEEILEALEEMPYTVLDAASAEKAESLKEQFGNLGATVELQAVKVPGKATAPQAFDVFVTEPGTKVLKVARLASQLGGIDLEKLMEGLEEPPTLVKEAASKEEADEIKQQLEEIGAAIELKPSASSPAPALPKAPYMKMELKKAGPRSMAVAKALAQITGADMDTLMEAMEELPYVITEKKPTAEALEISKQLEGLGAVVELTPVKPSHMDVILTNAGRKSMGVAKLVADATGKDMDTILEALEELPFTAAQGMPTAEAEALQKKLEASGASVELKEAAAPVQAGILAQGGTHDVIIMRVGSEYKRVVELLKGLAGIPEAQGQKIITHMPATVASNLSANDALTLRDALTAVGADVEVKPPVVEATPSSSGKKTSKTATPPKKTAGNSSPKQSSSNASINPDFGSKFGASTQAAASNTRNASFEEDLDAIMDRIDNILRGINDDNVFTCFKQNQQKLGNAIAKYAGGCVGETFLLQVDETLFGSADEGCVITDKAIYGRESFEDGVRVPLNRSIKKMQAGPGNKGIVIDGKKLCTLIMPDKGTVPKILELLKEVAKLND